MATQVNQGTCDSYDPFSDGVRRCWLERHDWEALPFRVSDDRGYLIAAFSSETEARRAAKAYVAGPVELGVFSADSPIPEEAP